MTDYTLNRQCANCSLEFSNSNEIFKSISIEDIRISSNPLNITVLNAVCEIYGSSTRNLAVAYLNNGNIENSNTEIDEKEVTETIKIILEIGLAFCFQCSIVLKAVYIHHTHLKQLSSCASLMTKAIKSFNLIAVKCETYYEGQEGIVSPEWDFSDFQCKENIDESVDVLTESSETKENILCEELECEVGFPEEPVCNEEEFKVIDWNETEGRPKRGRPRKHRNVENYCKNPTKIHRKLPKKELNKANKIKKEAIKVTNSSTTRSSQKGTFSTLSSPRKSSTISTGQTYEEPQISKENDTVLEENELKPQPKRKYISEERLKKLRLHMQMIRETTKRKKTNWNPRRKRKVTNTCDLDQTDMNPSVVVIPCDNLLYANRSLLNKNRFTTSETRKSNGKNQASKSSSIGYRCKRCDIIFTNYTDFRRHKRKEHWKQRPPKIVVPISEKEKESMFECSCGKFLSTLSGLRDHEKKICKSRESEVICDTCGEIFQKKYKLYLHKRVEHSESLPKSHICSICGNSFNWESCLRAHIGTMHSKIPKSFVCEKCGSTFTKLGSFSRHKQMHLDETLDKELFRCKECGVLLKHSEGLKKHIRIMHTNQKSFSCHLCGKATKSMTNMRIHMKVHDSNRAPKSQNTNSQSKSKLNLSKNETE